MKPRFALDLDGVVYDWQGAYRYLMNKHRGLELPPVEDFWHTWDAPDAHTTRYDREWIWTQGIELGLFRYGHIINGAIDGVRELATIGEVEVVTHRPPLAMRDTLAFLSFVDLPIEGVHVLPVETPKSTVDLDIYIDDAAHVAEEVTRAGKQVILVDRPWNQHVKGVPRADSWEGIIGWAREMT